MAESTPTPILTAHLTPFQVAVPEKALQDLKALLDLSPLPPVTYEGSLEDRKYGVTREWLVQAKEYWRDQFDWRKHEKHINSFAQFQAPIVDDDGKTYDIHFTALFSRKSDAIPLLFLHGWPGKLKAVPPELSFVQLTVVIR